MVQAVALPSHGMGPNFVRWQANHTKNVTASVQYLAEGMVKYF
jgi:hypothetical protein